VGGDRDCQQGQQRRVAERNNLDSSLRVIRRLKERMKEPRLCGSSSAGPKRREDQYFAAGFLGRPMRAKGFAHRELAVAWEY